MTTPPKPGLVLTMASSILDKIATTQRLRFRTSRAVAQDLIGSAKFEVILMAPYCHPGVVADLHRGLVAAVQRGARIRVFVAHDDGWDAQPFVRAMQEVLPVELLEIRAILPPTRFHAKIIMADGRRAYVGSGNLTPQAYAENFEAGVEIEGAQVQWLRDAVEHYLAEVASKSLI